MIVATRPEPTVRPPSRSSENEKMVIYGLFGADFDEKPKIFHGVFLFCGNFVAKM